MKQLANDFIVEQKDLTLRASHEDYLRQMANEERSRDLGEERYEKNLEKDRRAGREEGTTYGSRLLSQRISRVATIVKDVSEEVLAEELKGRPSVAMLAAERCRSVGYDVAAGLALREIIRSLSGMQILTTCAVEIGKNVEDEAYLSYLRDEDAKLQKRILDAANKKTDHRKKRESVYAIGRLAGYPKNPWTEDERLKVGKYLIDLVMRALPDFVTIENLSIKKGGKLKTINHIVATESTLAWIEKNVEYMRYVNPRREPMVVPPLPWEEGMAIGGGYITNAMPPLKMVKTRNNKYLEELKAAHMPKVLTAINAAQDTAWRIRPHVLELHKELKRLGRTVANAKMPEYIYLPLPEKPSFIEEHAANRKLIKAWERECKEAQKQKVELPARPTVHADYELRDEKYIEYRRDAAGIHQENVQRKGHLAMFNLVMSTVEHFKDEPRIYFPYQLDFRGRLYAVPTLNPQSSDWMKGLLEFSEGKPLGKRGAYWLKVNIANLFGQDKISFDDRVQWVEDNEAMILACAEDPITFRDWEEADKPFQAYANCVEYAGFKREGYSYISHTPIGLDGSCSGLQNLGMALRCEETGKNVNLIDADKPADIYQTVLDKVITHIDGVVGQCKNREEAQQVAIAEAKKKYFEVNDKASEKKWPKLLNQIVEPEFASKLSHRDAFKAEVRTAYRHTLAMYEWKEFGLKRKHSKRAVMTFPYGSKEFGFKEQIMQDHLRPLIKKYKPHMERGGISESVYREIFPFSGDGFIAAGCLAKLLYKYVRETVIKAAEIMEWMQDTAKLVAKENRPVRWTTPLGFPVIQDYRHTKEQAVCLSLFGKQVFADLHKPTDKINVLRMGNAISPNVTHSLDSSHLLSLVAQGFSEGITSFSLIHDDFGTHASETDHFFYIIREAFYELYTQTDIFEELNKEFTKQIHPDKRCEVPMLPLKGKLKPAAILEATYAFS